VEIIKEIPKENLNLNDQANQANPYLMYAGLREKTPVCLFKNGIYALTRYDDVSAALRSPENFFDGASVGGRGDWLPEDCEHAAFMVSESPPDHEKYRAIANRLFLPKVINEYKDFMAQTADALLDRVTPGQPFNFVREFAEPYTSAVLAKIVGIHTSTNQYADLVRKWHFLSEQNTPDAPESHRRDVIQITRELNAAYEKILEERRNNPSDDFISMLLSAKIDNERLSRKVVYGALDLFLSAGFTTTAQHVSNAILELAHRPELLATLAGNRDEIPAFNEELLRFSGPTHSVMRTTVRPVTIEGLTIPQGKPVHLLIASANRDPRVFDSPNEFLLHRPNIKRQIAFGYGVHICLGAALVRLETQVVLERMLERFSRIRCPRHEELDWAATLFTRGTKELPTVFQ